jgi:acetyl esterase/lipase
MFCVSESQRHQMFDRGQSKGKLKDTVMRRTSGMILAIWSVGLGLAWGDESSETVPYKQTENVVFHEVHGIGLLMDIFEPTAGKNDHAVVDVASGSYFSDRGKIRQHEKFKVYDEFCRKGYTVFVVRPGSMTKWAIPEMADHIKVGIRWVRANRDKYQLDTKKMGIVGASAGGHLASLVALTGDEGLPTSKDPLMRESCQVQACAAFFPPADFLAWGGLQVDLDKNPGVPLMFKNILFAGPAVPRSPERLRDQMMKVSPAHQVKPSSPPFLLFHGDKDPIVPMQQSEIFFRRLQEKGVDSQLIIKEGGEHPWPTLHEEVKVAVDWMDKKLRPSSVATSSTKP